MVSPTPTFRKDGGSTFRQAHPAASAMMTAAKTGAGDRRPNDAEKRKFELVMPPSFERMP